MYHTNACQTNRRIFCFHVHCGQDENWPTWCQPWPTKPSSCCVHSTLQVIPCTPPPIPPFLLTHANMQRQFFMHSEVHTTLATCYQYIQSCLVISFPLKKIEADQLTDQATMPRCYHTQGSSQTLSTISSSPYSPNHRPGGQGIPHTA